MCFGWENPVSIRLKSTRSFDQWVEIHNYPGAYGTHFHVETSATLANPWTPATEGLGAGFVEITGNEVKYTFPAVPAKTFARLVITGP